MSGPKTFYKRYWADEHIKINPFDIHPGEWADENFDHHMDAFDPYVSGKVLDYGCGDGQFSQRILPRCDQVYGVDVSKSVIERAKKRFPEPMFLVIDPEKELPFPDGFFDTICAIDVMEHLLDTESVLFEFNRVLKPDGKVLIATNELCRLKLILIALFFHNTYFYPASPHIRYFTRGSLEDLLRRKGFEVLRYRKNRTHLRLIPKGQLVVAKKVFYSTSPMFSNGSAWVKPEV